MIPYIQEDLTKADNNVFGLTSSGMKLQEDISLHKSCV